IGFNIAGRDECDARTKGYPGAKFKSFTNAAEAESFVSGSTYIAPSASTSKIVSSSSSTSDNQGKKRPMPEDILDEFECDVVYTDGACKGNGRSGSVAGVGVWWGENDPRSFHGNLALDCFNRWLPKWSKNNFRTAQGNPVKNLGVIQYLDTLLQVRRQFGQSVSLQYVKGHSNDTGNDGADAQANLGALLPVTPDRDWASAVKDAKKRAEEDLRKGGEKPIEAPLQIVPDGIAPLETSRKLRKVSHEVSFSRLQATTTKSPPRSKSLHSGPAHSSSLYIDPSPPPPTTNPSPKVQNTTKPLVSQSQRVPTTATASPPRTSELRSPGVKVEKTVSTARTRYPRTSTPDSPRADSPPPRYSIPTITSPRRVKKFKELPSASQRARDEAKKALFVSSAQPPKVTAMCVNEAEINLSVSSLVSLL
ncbi:hypothetical protein H0H81_002364, partial [Sphagnurus paluster]